MKQNTIGRRKFLKVVGAGAAAGGLAACAAPAARPAAAPAEQAAATAAPAAPAASGAVELQFWDMVWGPGEYIDTCKKLVEKFNSETPGIKVTYQSTPWSSWPQVFTTAIGSGTAPDISTGGGFQPVKLYAESDAILPVDDVYEEYKADGQINDFAAGTVAANQWDGHYIGVPWNLDIRSTFYRKDYFDAVGGAPKNWDELRASLKKVTKDKIYGYGFAGNSPLGSQQMMALMYNNGGALFDKDGKIDLLNERNVETFEFIGSLIKDGVVHPASAGWNENDLAKAWGEGTVGMTTWGFGFEQRAPEIKSKVAVLPPMTGPHGDKGTQVWINSIMCYKSTKHPAETKTFLKWWSKNTTEMWTVGHCGVLPARKSIAADPYFQNDEFAKPILNDWVPLGQRLGAKADGTFPLLGRIDGSDFLTVLATDIMQGADVKASLTKAAEALEKLKK